MAKKLTAAEIFRRKFKGRKNFLTPRVHKRGKINPNVAFELSSGRGFKGGRIYGVTVVSANKSGKTRSTNLSQAFSSKNNAEAHINMLRRKLKVKRKLKGGKK